MISPLELYRKCGRIAYSDVPKEVKLRYLKLAEKHLIREFDRTKDRQAEDAAWRIVTLQHYLEDNE